MTSTSEKFSLNLTKKHKTVAVLIGGWSAEREVSLSSGKACAAALEKAGYTVKTIDVSRDLNRLSQDLSMNEKGDMPDVIFNALHGQGGEDGCIQGALDMIGIPYTHSGRLTSALCMNKKKSKDALRPHNIPCAKDIVLSGDDISPDNIPFDPPYVIKPNEEGSSVGIYIVKDRDNRLTEIFENWTYGDMMVEEYIPGRELTVAVMGAPANSNEEPQALTVTEIRSIGHDFYDYDAKYADGGSEHLLPAPVDQDVFDACKNLAILAHKHLGCQGVTRTDFRYNDEKTGIEGIYYLETNTQPGMTPTSLLPEQAEFCGIDFETLVSWMVENASLR